VDGDNEVHYRDAYLAALQRRHRPLRGWLWLWPPRWCTCGEELGTAGCGRLAAALKAVAKLT